MRSVLLNKSGDFWKVATKRVAENFEIFQVLLEPIAIPLSVIVLNRKVIPFLFQMLNMQSSSSSVQNVASGERNVPDGALQSCCVWWFLFCVGCWASSVVWCFCLVGFYCCFCGFVFWLGCVGFCCYLLGFGWLFFSCALWKDRSLDRQTGILWLVFFFRETCMESGLSLCRSVYGETHYMRLWWFTGISF